MEWPQFLVETLLMLHLGKHTTVSLFQMVGMFFSVLKTHATHFNE